MAKKKLPVGIQQLKTIVAFLEQTFADPAEAGQQEQPAPDQETDPQMAAQALQPAPEPEPEDQYAGPDENDIVGDNRRMSASSLSSDFDVSGVGLGEAWQDDDGNLHGTGLMAVMLFEPAMRQRYRSMSIGLDVSPLTILAKRLSRGSFLRARLVDGDNES